LANLYFDFLNVGARLLFKGKFDRRARICNTLYYIQQKNMRNIVTISLPKQLDEQIEKEVKDGRFASKSEFIRSLIRLWQEEQVLKDLRQSKKEIAAGLGKELKSLKDCDEFAFCFGQLNENHLFTAFCAVI